MAKKTTRPTDKKPVKPSSAPAETITLSVRLTEAQHALLTQAAELRGWSPTSLLRSAALEKAAHIVNTSTPTRIEFQAIAILIAQQLCLKPKVRVMSRDGTWELADVLDDLEGGAQMHPDIEHAVYIEPQPWSAFMVEQLAGAVRFGGTEFLNMILMAGKSMTAPKQNLPDPIDPNIA